MIVDVLQNDKAEKLQQMLNEQKITTTTRDEVISLHTLSVHVLCIYNVYVVVNLSICACTMYIQCVCCCELIHIHIYTHVDMCTCLPCTFIVYTTGSHLSYNYCCGKHECGPTWGSQWPCCRDEQWCSICRYLVVSVVCMCLNLLTLAPQYSAFHHVVYNNSTPVCMYVCTVVFQCGLRICNCG